MQGKGKEARERLSVILCSLLLHTSTILAGHSCPRALSSITSGDAGSIICSSVWTNNLYPVSQRCVLLLLSFSADTGDFNQIKMRHILDLLEMEKNMQRVL